MPHESTAHERSERTTTPPADRRQSPAPGIEDVISRVLRIGVAVSVALLAAGLLLGLVRGPLGHAEPGALDGLLDPDVGQPHTPADVWSSLRQGEAAGLVVVGLGVLVLTPLVRVVASLVTYARAGDRTYLAFTVVVLALLGLSAAIGAG